MIYRQLDGVHDVWSGLRHFKLVGDREGLAPSLTFSGTAAIWSATPIWRIAGVPPLAHYLTWGIGEGRACFPEHDPSVSLTTVDQSDADGRASEIAEAEVVGIVPSA